MNDLNEILVMFDLEYLSKDDINGQILEIGVCIGSHPDHISPYSFKPSWQQDAVVNPSTLKFWADSPKELKEYLGNKDPMERVCLSIIQMLQTIKSVSKSTGRPVILMSKGITHDLPKVEYLLHKHCNKQQLDSILVEGFGIFESMFGYNCRRDLRSFKMYRSEEELGRSYEYGERLGRSHCPKGELHNGEYDAITQWGQFYHIATGPHKDITPTGMV
jgi:hypothetical protein